MVWKLCHCNCPRHVRPAAVAHPDTPPYKLQAKSRRGGVKQPHPLMSPHRGWARSEPIPDPCRPGGSLPCWGLTRKLLPGSPRDHWGLSGQADTGASPASIAPRCPVLEPSGRCQRSTLCCPAPKPRLLLPQRVQGKRRGPAGVWLPLPGPVHLSVCVYVYTCVTCVHMGR